MTKRDDKLLQLRKIQIRQNKKMDLETFNQLTYDFSYSDSALLWFQLNLKKIVTSEELAQIWGKNTGKPISHNIRRIFELRDEKGYNIINHKDEDSGLKVDEWKLLDEDPDENKIRERGVTKRIRFEVFERDNYTCQVCGLSQGDDDPYKEGRKITLHVGHIKAHKRQDPTETVKKKLDVDDFITLCNVCNEGEKNKDFKGKITLLELVKKSSDGEKQSIYDYLTDYFKEYLNRDFPR